MLQSSLKSLWQDEHTRTHLLIGRHSRFLWTHLFAVWKAFETDSKEVDPRAEKKT